MKDMEVTEDMEDIEDIEDKEDMEIADEKKKTIFTIVVSHKVNRSNDKIKIVRMQFYLIMM